MRKRVYIKSHKKSSRKSEQMSLRELLLLATAAMGFVKMFYDLFKDILG